MKNLITLLVLLLVFSCNSYANTHQKKTVKTEVLEKYLDLTSYVIKDEIDYRNKTNYSINNLISENKKLNDEIVELKDVQQQILIEIEKLKSIDDTGTVEPPTNTNYPVAVNPNNIDWSSEPYVSPNPSTPISGYLVPVDEGIVTITRIADETAFGQGGSVTQHNYASKAVWNSDETLMMLSDQNARILNADDYSVEYTVNLPSYENWSNLDPFKIFGTQSDNQFVSMDVRTGTRTVLRTFTGYTNISIGKGEGRQDENDKYVILIANKGGSEWLISYDIATDTIVAELELPIGNLDFATISNSGNYVVISWADSGTGSNQGLKVYDYDLANGKHTSNYTEHGDIGIDEDGAEVFVQLRDASQSLGVTDYYFEMIRLSDGQVDGLYFDTSTPTPRGVWGAHISGRNTERPGWIYLSENMASGDVMANEVFALKLSRTENLIERYFKHHSDRTVGYNHEAQVCVNKDGTKMIFKSNRFNTTEKGKTHAVSYIAELN